MGAVASVLTFTAGQFRYVDVSGIEHTVTASQTMTMSIDDNSTTDVQYSFKTLQSMTTTDGYKIVFRPSTAGAALLGGTNGNDNRTVGKFTDAGQGSAFKFLSGEFYADSPCCGTLQIWKPAQITPSDADYGSAGTITMVLEDQFGHSMSIPFALSGTVSVAQAA